MCIRDSPSTVARIAELLNTTADYLLGLYRPVSNVSAPEERFFGSYTAVSYTHLASAASLWL